MTLSVYTQWNCSTGRNCCTEGVPHLISSVAQVLPWWQIHVQILLPHQVEGRLELRVFHSCAKGHCFLPSSLHLFYAEFYGLSTYLTKHAPSWTGLRPYHSSWHVPLASFGGSPTLVGFCESQSKTPISAHSFYMELRLLTHSLWIPVSFLWFSRCLKVRHCNFSVTVPQSLGAFRSKTLSRINVKSHHKR